MISRVIRISLFYQNSTCFVSAYFLKHHPKCNYDPNRKVDGSWQAFHERLLLNDNIPINYFSIFKEL
ncbi:hypothetical protein V5I80_05520 [Acinetobacter radioresistens]|uniref:hypothetical protein n=1 Tax=Acinetobacter radioresistens TaxID=40216 RepID=UPI002FCD6FA8